MSFFRVVLLLCVTCSLGKCARILGFFTTVSLSHQITFQSICRELALRGHQVTFISPNVINDNSLRSLREIDINHAYDLLKTINVTKALSKDASIFDRMQGFYQLTRIPTEIALDDQKVQDLLKSDETFDILIVQALHPLNFALAAKYKIPIIGR